MCTKSFVYSTPSYQLYRLNVYFNSAARSSHHEYTQVPSSISSSRISPLAQNQPKHCLQNHMCYWRSSSNTETCTSSLSSGHQQWLLLGSYHPLSALPHSVFNARLGTIVFYTSLTLLIPFLFGACFITGQLALQTTSTLCHFPVVSSWSRSPRDFLWGAQLSEYQRMSHHFMHHFMI